MTIPTFRLGVPHTGGRLIEEARRLGAPILLSANAFSRSWPTAQRPYRPHPGFKAPGEALSGLDIALDSAGYTLMAQHRGMVWSVPEYVRLAASFPWAWWAAMDCCCEPGVARDRTQVMLRIAETARLYGECREEARRLDIPDPLPVIQGWHASDYQTSLDLLPIHEWPALVGIGSVCRRHMGGTSGVVAIVEALDRMLPSHVGFHLFGVHSDALAVLADHPRVASADSMAWSKTSRLENRGRNNLDTQAGVMRRWYERQMRVLLGQDTPRCRLDGRATVAESAADAPHDVPDEIMDLIAAGEVEATSVSHHWLEAWAALDVLAASAARPGWMESV